MSSSFQLESEFYEVQQYIGHPLLYGLAFGRRYPTDLAPLLVGDVYSDCLHAATVADAASAVKEVKVPDDAECSQPTASLGERLARLEAVFDARAALDVESVKLTDEKLNGLRKELQAVNSAQREAVDKAERATDRRLELIGGQIEADRALANTRLQALERGEAGAEGANRYKAGQVAWIGAAAAFATVIIYTVILVHP